jgi:uncharacterized sulfatase
MIFAASAVSTVCLQKHRFPLIRPPMRETSALIVALLLTGLNIAAAEQPNILWLTCEDMSPHLGCYGDDYAITPNLDALAARGMRYTNASSNSPVCAPARTTIITGLYPPSIGAEHMRSEVRLPAGFRLFPQLLRDVGYYCTNNSKEDYNVAKPGRVWDVSSPKAHWKNRRDGQPFFAVFNHTITHESQIRNHINPANQIHDPAKARVPAYHPDTPEVRRDWAQYYDRITMMDAEVGANLNELDEAGLTDETIVFFYSDHGSGMPRSKRWLYNSGLNVPLIVYFPPKWQHLAPKDYKPGGLSDRLVSFIDLAPTVLSLAGINPPNWMQGGAFAGEHETAEPEFSYGFRGRMDERYDFSRSVRDKRFLYIRNYMPHRPYGQHVSYMFETPTTRVWQRLFQQNKLNDAQAAFWQPKPIEELYDLKSDPEQVHNLINSPDRQPDILRMRVAHREWERRIKDLGYLSEWELHARSKDTTPFEMGHDPGRYDFDSIRSAAEWAAAGDPGAIPYLVQLLHRKDSGVRYWATVGLLAQEKAGVDAARDELVASLADESPMVQITAAEVLGRFGSESDANKALDVLLYNARPESNYYLAVAAWNALDHLDERARPALDKIRSLPTKWGKVPPRMDEYPTRLKQKTLADLH